MKKGRKSPQDKDMDVRRILQVWEAVESLVLGGLEEKQK